MNNFGLIGKDISYSLSPLIHNFLYNYYEISATYNLVDVNDLSLLTFEDLLKFKGLNVTKPYKVEITKEFDVNIQEDFNVVNTLMIKNEKLFGYNTDILAFKKFYEKKIKNVDSVGLLGNSATSKMLRYFFNKYHKDVKVYTFSTKISDNTYLYDKITNFDIDFLINTTPLGQGEYEGKSILNIEQIKHLSPKYVLDFNYAPLHTKLLKESMSQGIKCFNGLEILVRQAVYSFEIWNEIKVNEDVINNLLKYVYTKSSSGMLLYGMPLSGKTTLYNRIKDLDFLDVIELDNYIETTENIKIDEYILKNGIDKFRRLEYKYINTLKKNGKNGIYQIIVCGGGTLTSGDIYDLIDDYILNFYNIELEELKKRLNDDEIKKRPLLHARDTSKNFEKIYFDRINTYIKSSTFITRDVKSIYEMINIVKGDE